MPANLVSALVACPRCGVATQQEIEAEIDGQGATNAYAVGDLVDWLPAELGPERRDSVSGYVVCANCGRDFFVRVQVSDRIDRVEVDTMQQGYIP